MSDSVSLSIGSLVTAQYKTGEYIGEVVEQSSPSKAAVQILAVVKHPSQGDLHNPMNPNVPFFHQRRALAFREIALMPLYTIQPYEGDVPDYKTSLDRSLQEEMDAMKQSPYKEWAERCLEELVLLKQDYGLV
ncbi:kinase-associated lipoprotein B [Paenibacillus rigui]|uniref:Kinase n=1 Tax=Paenibacillus rigui TaxID=554312 RepID=A0A229UX78_9BACL|nr:kinase-associated lipoprotein B [Paenibacillus rigui]OXM87871.1 kinase [Paenibacillus rigui]